MAMGNDSSTCCISFPECGSIALVEGGLTGGDCYVATVSDDGAQRVEGLFDAATGNVYACGAGEDPRTATPAPQPAIRIAGDPNGQSGYVGVIQPDGTYRRYSRWDRIAQTSIAHPGATVRTLPQCGCGGSIGMPKLFDSFAQMSAYFFFTFVCNTARSQ